MANTGWMIVTQTTSNNYSHRSLGLILGYHFIPHWKQAQISKARLELSQHVKGAEWCVYVVSETVRVGKGCVCMRLCM